MVSEVPAIIRWDQAYNRSGARVPRDVVNVIRTYMNNTTLAGFVRQETLATATGLSIRQVRRQITSNVEAGWLEVTERGNSSGLASSYRLTYPKADTNVPLPNADTDVRLEPMRTRMCGRGGHICPEKADIDVPPTSPTTSPGTSPKRSSRETYPGLSGPGIDHPPTESTSESNADIYVPLGNPDTNVLLDEDPFGEGSEQFAWSPDQYVPAHERQPASAPKPKPAASYASSGITEDPFAD